MKYVIALALTLAATAGAAEVVVKDGLVAEIESETYPADGVSVANLTTRARDCALELLTNAGNVARDAGDTTGFRDSASVSIAGSDVLQVVDPESGRVVAMQNADYRHMMSGMNVRSTVTVMARDGRFRIRHSNIEALQKNTGYMANDGYRPIHTGFGAGSKPAIKRLEEVTTELAACIQVQPSQDDW